MAERKFDYEAISQIYANMNTIIGDTGDASSITGILSNIDKNYHELVDVEDAAIYGDLAKQLLLDWENTSSNFPTFVENFQNWAALISKSAGEYSQFEQDVKGFKEANPLGTTSAGRTINYVDDSKYRKYTTENVSQFIEDYSNLDTLKAVTAADYVTTNSQSILSTHKTVTGIVAVADLAAIIWSGVAGIGVSGAGTAATSTSTQLVPQASAGSATSAGSTGATTTGAAALEGPATAAIEGTARGMGMSEFAEQVALTNGMEKFIPTLNQIEQAGATFVQHDSATGIIKFFNASGEAIAEIVNGTLKWL